MALYHFSAKVFSRSGRNTVRAVAYRAGCKLADSQTGETFDYRHKSVEQVELLLPKDAPQWALEAQKLMGEGRQKGVQAFVDVVERAEKRINSQVWKEFEFALHRELTKEQNMALAREFVQDQICSRGMAVQLNFHFDKDKETGEEKPHCHVLVTTRHLSEKGMGEKERDWNKKELLSELRVQWQECSNFHLKLHGHNVSIDHRCNKDRGIEMEPQPKRGKNIVEQERRLDGSFSSSITEKAKDFQSVQLRNLYRIMRRPDVVLEIVSKHQSTFMWADVRKVLHRYVDDLPLFQKLEDKLKNSNELMVLRAEGIESGDKAIYTTRTLLKAEKSLVETADKLDQSKSHGTKEHHIEAAIECANEKLKKHGGLSSDQEKAIHHLVDEGQIKCVVGIAGAGKTTALGVSHDIWKAEGYAVYGLAPTGKAAQNLEQGGISSTTLHKFLISFEEGRCQYNSNSVLVLDEAGMVDMERFEKLLSAVNHLAVKLIVVGDGAQLQPVEAGPAFRLVTQRLGKSELNTVLRQKEEWQRSATVLFGKQETQAAIQKYMNKGHVHIIDEKLHSLHEAVINNDRESIVKLYEVSSRTSSLIYREMAKDVQRDHPQGTSTFALIKQHQDFDRYMEWKELQKSSATQILKEGEDYYSFLEARGLDSTKMAMLFVDKKLDKVTQQERVLSLLKKSGLESLVGIEKQPGQGVDVRQDTKDVLIRAWHSGFKESPEKNSLMLSFSNRDTNDLNRTARAFLKKSGHLSKEEFTYTISKMVEDDFGRERFIHEEKNFSKGDRIVFTRNTQGLGVKNGTMGTIVALNKQTVQIKLHEGKEISFAPSLNPYFDQGWAITIHKSQGTTVDNTYLLASYEMTQNLAYVAMTRHRENVHVFGSSLDFWRQEKLPEVLSKSGEKLSAGDYLDADSLNKLMQKDDRLLIKIFERISNELEAMGSVSKKAFWQVADYFLDRNKEKEIRIDPGFSQEAVREEVRAEQILKDSIKDTQKASEKPMGISGKKVFETLTQQCAQKLYAYLGEERIDLTPDLIKRVESQAEKAANFIFHAHTLKGTQSTEKETKLFLLRAKYELDRIPEICDELIHKWQQAGSYKGENDELIAHMIAERQASIEGRMVLDAKLKPLPIIPDLAAKEIKTHRAKTETLAQELIQKHGLSETAAIYCAKDILRHQEAHGEKPSSEQMAAMVQISRELDKTGYSASIGQANIEYLRRRDGDLQFREMSTQGKDLSGFKDFPHKEKSYSQPQTPVKSHETQKPARAIEENAKAYEIELSI